MDKRDRRRKKTRLTVLVEPGAIRGHTADLSYQGLFLVTTKVFKPGARVRLVVRTREGDNALGVGVVRWSKRVPPALIRTAKGGMGIEFTWISPELKELIEQEIV